MIVANELKVVPSASWLTLLACVILIAAGIVWAFTASLPVRVDAYGVLGGAAYVSVLDAPLVHPGLKVEMEMSHVRSEEHGHLLAYTGEVGRTPATKESMRSELGDGRIAKFIRRHLRVAPVEVKIIPTATWLGPPPKQALYPGIFFHALITVENRRPIDFVLGK